MSLEPDAFQASVLARLDRLEQLLLAALPKGSAQTITRSDRQPAPPGLLKAIHATVSDSPILASELVEEAKQAPKLAAALRDALGEDSTVPKCLGKLLSRLDGASCDGLRIGSIGTVREGRLWQVVRV